MQYNHFQCINPKSYIDYHSQIERLQMHAKNAKMAFSHPLERLANGPVDLCSEKPVAAGWGGAHEVGGGHWSIWHHHESLGQKDNPMQVCRGVRFLDEE